MRVGRVGTLLLSSFGELDAQSLYLSEELLTLRTSGAALRIAARCVLQISSSGPKQWTLSLSKISAASGTGLVGPAVVDSNGMIYVTYLGANGAAGGVTAIDAKGTVLWRWTISTPSPSLSSPVIGGSGRPTHIFTATRYT